MHTCSPAYALLYPVKIVLVTAMHMGRAHKSQKNDTAVTIYDIVYFEMASGLTEGIGRVM